MAVMVIVNRLSKMIFISDCNPKFTSAFWTEVWSLLRTKLKMSSARHLQTDGQSECSIKTLEQYLWAFINYNQTNWDLLLPLAEFAYNSSVHSSTGLTPFQTTYSYQPTHHWPSLLTQPSNLTCPLLLTLLLPCRPPITLLQKPSAWLGSRSNHQPLLTLPQLNKLPQLTLKRHRHT